MILYVVLLPLIGAILTGLNTQRISKNFAAILTSSFVVVSALLSSYIFYEVTMLGETAPALSITWFNIGSFVANWSLKVDSLTAVMLIVVTYVSALVHIYSYGYMHEDQHVQRFMSYLSLFTFCMLMLVTSDNLVQLFFGWKGRALLVSANWILV